MVVVLALVALYNIQSWFNRLRTPTSALVYVLAGSFAFYCLAIAIRTAFTQQVELAEQPSFLFIPLALALAAAMQVLRKPREPSA